MQLEFIFKHFSEFLNEFADKKILMLLPENLSVLRLRHFIPLKYVYTHELKILFNLFKSTLGYCGSFKLPQVFF